MFLFQRFSYYNFTSVNFLQNIHKILNCFYCADRMAQQITTSVSNLSNYSYFSRKNPIDTSFLRYFSKVSIQDPVTSGHMRDYVPIKTYNGEMRTSYSWVAKVFLHLQSLLLPLKWQMMNWSKFKIFITYHVVYGWSFIHFGKRSSLIDTLFH